MTASMPRSGTARVGDVALVRAVGGHEDRHRSGRGLRVFKCGVVWPLEAASVREFATGLEEILVVEEKRQILEYALKEELDNWRDDVRPKIYGKFDEKDGRGGEWAMPQGRWLLPAHAELSPALIAKAIAARLLEPGRYGSRFELAPDVRAGIESRLAILAAKERSLAAPHVVVERTPTFCSGCPHNTSTHVPEGSRALAGIGCHYMTTWMPERRTGTFTQMGGEGVPWIGQAPFTAETHVFANLGDGTYFHSGLLAIRASIAAGVNITYKILYNDAITRPALANERVQTNAAGQVVLKLKTPWRDGTTHLVMSPLEFMQRLAALVPRPRLHLIRFGVRITSLREVSGPPLREHGVLAPNAKLRALVVPQVVPQESEPAAQPAKPAECEARCARHRPVRLGWARLLKRVFDLDLEHCPNCSGELRIIAAILEQPVIEKILMHLGLQARAPPRAPARGQALRAA